MARWQQAPIFVTVGAFGASTVSAEVTPEDVWQNWQRVSAAYGQALTADSVARDGDTLVAKGVKTFMSEDGAEFNGTVEEMRFRDLGDGSVEVTASDTYKMAMNFPGEDGAKQAVNATILEPGLKVIATGTPEETHYAYEIPTFSLTMEALEDGKAVADIRADASAISGTYLVKSKGEITEGETSMALSDLNVAITGSDPETPFTATAKSENMTFSGSGTFIGLEPMVDLSDALKSGLKFDLSFSSGPSDLDLKVTEEGKATSIKAATQSSDFSFGLSADNLRYGAGAKGGSWIVSGGDIPFPELTLSYAEVAFDLLLPVMASDAPKDFTYVTRFVDFAVSPELWGIVDPAGAFPRDPATVIIDAKGKARLTTDLFDEEGMDALGDVPPGEIHALTLTELLVRAVGAELSGKADVTFDNSDLTTFDGVPAPTGTVDVTVTGGNGLLNKLVDLGLVAGEEAMGIRMMLAMFTKPGEGEDVLNSTLEFKDKGFYANGQRLK
ncbi:DUF2125 domain-containing protein [Thioclava sp. FR2]|uniref:DUF2125 domain-containing protein n=1 Tax=Thioclava sp. FR2 TaxID=3445780 RepID=UPI003EBF9DD9